MALEDYLGDEFTHALKEIIEQNLNNEDFSIEQLCKEVGLSRSHLHRKIKSSTGLSISLFIRKVRLYKAKELLQTSNYNISEIAYLTGNKSPQNFSKYFIEEFGVSPSQYRKEKQEEQQTSVVQEPTIKEKPGSSNNKLFRAALIIISLCLILVFIIGQKDKLFNLGASKAVSEADPFRSIAVIPFQNYGTDSDEFFSEGVVEDILTYLAQFDGLRVVSRTSTAQFKNTDKSIQEIGRQLNVNYILEGSVRQDSQNFIISAQLIRVSDDQHVWAERYDRLKKNVIETQREVAKSIAGALNQSISSKVRQKLERVSTNNIEAYTALLRGRYLLRSRTKEDLFKSLDQFQAALALDSAFAEAYVGMAQAYSLLAGLRYAPDQEKQYEQLAEKNALHAIRYDKNNGSAYSILANLYASQYRWEEAIAAFKIALDLNPNDALVNYWYSLVLRTVGDLEQSLSYHKIAGELDPLYPVIQAGHIYTCVLAGEYDRAEEILGKIEPVMGESFLYYYVKGNFLLQKGDYEAALPICSKALDLNPTFKQPESDKYYCMAKMGKKEPVVEYLSSLDTTQALDCLRAAKIYIGLEESDRGIQLLLKAASMDLIPEDIIVNPIYAAIRNHPTFIEILKKYNLYSFYVPLKETPVLAN